MDSYQEYFLLYRNMLNWAEYYLRLVKSSSYSLKGTIQSLVAEHPQQTEIKQLGRSPDGRYLYDIRFHKLGENIIWVNYNHGEKSFLEFFSTEPLDVLIKKRSSFIVNKQQHKAPGKWWDGLYSVYDMKYGKLRR